MKRPPKEVDEEGLPDGAADSGDSFLDPPSGAGTAPEAASTDSSGESTA